jgi:class 3 adenylate cyclase
LSSKNELDLKQQVFKLNVFNTILHEILHSSITYDSTKEWDLAYSSTTGDGAVLCFTDPTNPFLLSIILHRRLRDRNVNISNDLEKIQIRIGISGGETMTVTHFNGKTAPWGKDMILAKRIMDKGGPNHILVSEQVVQQIRQLRKDYKFMDMGEHILKHGEKVRVFSFLFQDANKKIGSTEPIGWLCERC